MELHDVSYGIEYVARPLPALYSPLKTVGYSDIHVVDMAYTGICLDARIRRIFLDIITTIASLQKQEQSSRKTLLSGGYRDRSRDVLVQALLMLYSRKQFNLAYYIAKRMEWVTKQARLILLYVRRDRGTRRGRPSTSSSTFDQPSSSHLNDDDDDGNDEDITLSLSPITPLENLSSPSSPSPPPPQPPVMGHPLYYNYHDYHGSTCICCFHNRNLHLNLRDEMNIMFAHLEYLITTAFTTHFPPQP
ncbi:hypothetical protein Tco_0570953 [Tanacetum coccineum]